MRLLTTTALGALLLVGCTISSEDDAGPGGDMDSGMDSGPPATDSGPRTCDNDVDCDDGFPCTIDTCVVGNVCEYTAVQERCPDGEVCTLTEGCRASTGDCTTDADCDDMDACTGTEMCLREMCVPGRPFNCSDGNACTTDICDQTVPGMCRYELAAGCDAGGPLEDAGPPCDAFDPATDYTGTYSLLPGQACDAGLGAGYDVRSATFSVSGGVLTVQAGPFTLTQSPAPTTGMFDVSGSNGCASVRITGEFMCRGSFRGTWMITHTSSACVMRCTDGSRTIVGS